MLSNIHLSLICIFCGLVRAFSEQPHIIFILADDLGWDDVGFHGSQQIPTPHLDGLAYDGIILSNYYVQPLCTPSRAALLTARYPIHVGLQHSVLMSAQPYGLPLNETILPQYLKQLGYHTHIVGKWHLGFFTEQYTPTHRGFDSHYGYYQGCGDYFDHTYAGVWPDDHKSWGFDFRRDSSTDRTVFGQYSTELFTTEAENIIAKHNVSEPLFLYMAHQAVHCGNPVTPLEAPYKFVQRVSHIKTKTRQMYAAMVSALDESVGNITRALFNRGILDNSIIIFSTDNGGPADGYNWNDASNWPLRGLKSTLWEGGVRGVGFIWSARLKKSGYISKHLMHISDWLPTLLHAVNASHLLPDNIDGVDQWEALSNNKAANRSEILLNIDPVVKESAIRVGDMKLVSASNGATRHCAGWYPTDSSWRRGINSSVWGSPCSDTGIYDKLSTVAELDLQDIQQERYYLDRHHSEFDHTSSSINKNKQSEICSILERIGRHCRHDNEPHLMVTCGPRPANASTNCRPWIKPCLYNINLDPCEFVNLADTEPQTVDMLLHKLHIYSKSAVKPLNKPVDDAGLPYRHNWTWVPWIKSDPET